MSSLLKSIQTARCLVLDKRWEQYLKLEWQFIERLGIHLNPCIAGDGQTLASSLYNQIDSPTLPPYIPGGIEYQTWYSRPNAYNAYKAHKLMMMDAISNDCETVLMVEDDAFLEDDFESILATTEDFFANNPWDMIYFGAYHQETTRVHDHILKLNGSGGWHCMLMKTHIIPKLLAFGPIGPFDWIAGKYIQPTHNCYGIYPCIASQADGHSYVEGHHLSKPARDKI